MEELLLLMIYRKREEEDPESVSQKRELVRNRGEPWRKSPLSDPHETEGWVETLEQP